MNVKTVVVKMWKPRMILGLTSICLVLLSGFLWRWTRQENSMKEVRAWRKRQKDSARFIEAAKHDIGNPFRCGNGEIADDVVWKLVGTPSYKIDGEKAICVQASTPRLGSDWICYDENVHELSRGRAMLE